MGWKSQWTDAEVLAVLWAHRARGQTAAQLAMVHGCTRNAIVGLVHRIDSALTVDQIAALPDEVWLHVLDRFEAGGQSAEALSKEFDKAQSGCRLTRNAVLALVHLARLDLWRAGPCEATRPENRNGGLPRCWWARGIWARGEAA